MGSSKVWMSVLSMVIEDKRRWDWKEWFSKMLLLICLDEINFRFPQCGQIAPKLKESQASINEPLSSFHPNLN